MLCTKRMAQNCTTSVWSTLRFPRRNEHRHVARARARPASTACSPCGTGVGQVLRRGGSRLLHQLAVHVAQHQPPQVVVPSHLHPNASNFTSLTKRTCSLAPTIQSLVTPHQVLPVKLCAVASWLGSC